MGKLNRNLLTGGLASLVLLLGLGAMDSYASAKACKAEPVAKQCKLLRANKQYKSLAACLADKYDEIEGEACQNYVLYRKSEFAATHAACASDINTFCSDAKNKRSCLQSHLSKERTFLERLASGKKQKGAREVAQVAPVALSPVCAIKLIRLNGLLPLPVVTNLAPLSL